MGLWFVAIRLTIEGRVYDRIHTASLPATQGLFFHFDLTDSMYNNWTQRLLKSVIAYYLVG